MNELKAKARDRFERLFNLRLQGTDAHEEIMIFFDSLIDEVRAETLKEIEALLPKPEDKRDGYTPIPVNLRYVLSALRNPTDHTPTT